MKVFVRIFKFKKFDVKRKKVKKVEFDNSVYSVVRVTKC